MYTAESYRLAASAEEAFLLLREDPRSAVIGGGLWMRSGSGRYTGRRFWTACWFSHVTAICTCSQPPPQSGGRLFSIRSGRLVIIKNVQS